MELKGRPIKARKLETPSERLSRVVSEGGDASGGGRYFSTCLSLKCYACGQTGHRQKDCTNEPLPTPCHLCAGTDHDPSKRAALRLKPFCSHIHMNERLAD